MPSRANFVFLVAGSGVLVSCSLAMSLDGFSGAARRDAGAFIGPEQSLPAADSGATPEAAANDSGAQDSGNQDASVPTFQLVQEVSSNGNPSISFPKPTTPGTLLVAMRPDTARLAGPGWSAATSSNGSDTISFWANNPGGLVTFAVPTSGGGAAILAEFQGPPSVRIDVTGDTGPKGSEVSSLQLPPTAPVQGALVLLYADTFAASVVTPTQKTTRILPTDGKNDFAFWTLGPGTAQTWGISILPASPASLMLVALRPR